MHHTCQDICLPVSIQFFNSVNNVITLQNVNNINILELLTEKANTDEGTLVDGRHA